MGSNPVTSYKTRATCKLYRREFSSEEVSLRYRGLAAVLGKWELSNVG